MKSFCQFRLLRRVAVAPRVRETMNSTAAPRSCRVACASACDTAAHARFCNAMLARGVYPPPAQFEAWFVSLAHDESSVDRTLEAAAAALEEALA